MKKHLRFSANEAGLCTTLWLWTHSRARTPKSLQGQSGLDKRRARCTERWGPTIVTTFRCWTESELFHQKIRRYSSVSVGFHRYLEKKCCLQPRTSYGKRLLEASSRSLGMTR